MMDSGVDRELEWLEREVRLAAALSDEDRIRILRDLWRTAEAIERTKSPEQRRREAEVRRILEDEPVRIALIALADRLR